MKDDAIDVVEGKSDRKGSLVTKVKIAGVLLILILATVVILQNTESVETKILFMELKMPLAMLFLLCFLLGAGVGFFLAFLRPWRKPKS